MVTELQLIGILIATVLGALTSWGLGWGDSGSGEFSWDKAIPSIVRAIIGGFSIFVATYMGFAGEVNLFTFILAYFAGMGIDAGGNRLAGVLRGSSK